MLLKAKDKDKRYFTLQKSRYSNETKVLNDYINRLKTIIAEKDKIIQLQGIKMKEVLYANNKTRVTMLKEDFEVLSKLANPNTHKKGIPTISKGKMNKLEDHRDLEHKYGRNANLKMSKSKKKVSPNYTRLDYMPVKDNNFESTFGRSRSVMNADNRVMQHSDSK
jgi:hypothetical protein